MAEGGTVGDRLRRARRRRFVGRSGEIELFRGALADGDFSVLFLHGPGGVGKSALLGEMAEAARQAGVAPVLVDARTITPEAGAFLRAVEAPRGRYAVLVDTYELLAPLDDWVRERFVPGLAADTVVVIAGRDAPSARWIADAGWHELLRVVSLRNLSPDDARAYLDVEGVPAELHERILRLAHGHPLTLSLLVDMIRRRREVPGALSGVPDVVRALLGRLVDEVPGPRHREALQICAHARFTTEELLRAMVGDGAGPLFGWLRTLSFVEEREFGVFPHDVVRDILDADLRWRDPDGYAALHRALRAHLVERARAAREDELVRHRAVADIMFLSRDHPVVKGYWRLGGLGRLSVSELGPGGAETVLAMTREHQGHEQARFAARWIERQPGAFGIFRDDAGEPFGYAAYLALHEADEEDLQADPGTRAMWSHATRHGPPRPGESVLAWRFFVDTERGRRPSRSETMIRLWHGQEVITRGGKAWDLVTVPSDREYWDPLLSFFDFHHAPDASYRVGGMLYEVYAHDWRVLGVDDWLSLTAERELGAPVAAATAAAPELVLSQPEFADAVRAALRDLRRPDRLAGNPLLRSRLVRSADDPGAALRSLLEETAEALRNDPREESLYRVVDRTFLRPAATQERAAEMLGLPFSTYRRYRNRAVERIAASLWEKELYGTGHHMDS
ncbi:AAA family ATPase [Actinomadura sp. K4S16]|uniref:AAA family ATPase n=1 Tax=Actinomadura sp. K4S16 TaxID=1316147 RepID=UPI001F278D3E|nr:AAA family ATPase [Actinomadura sp. K4S16]